MKMNKPIKTYELYDVVKVPFPFSDVKDTKIRPALIISNANHFNAKLGISIMAMITSVKTSQTLWSSDILIEDIQQAGLPAPSLIRFKLFTLDHRLILGHLGCLSNKDHQQVQKKLKEILSF